MFEWVHGQLLKKLTALFLGYFSFSTLHTLHFNMVQSLSVSQHVIKINKMLEDMATIICA